MLGQVSFPPLLILAGLNDWFISSYHSGNERRELSPVSPVSFIGLSIFLKICFHTNIASFQNGRFAADVRRKSRITMRWTSGIR